MNYVVKKQKSTCLITSIFIEDNVFSTTASLPYGPLMNTDIDYFRTFFVIIIRTFSY